MHQLTVQAFTTLLKLYQHTLSPDHGPLHVLFPSGVCRYHPTCSDYCARSISLYGWRGVALSLRRLVRCHPLAAGGYDPPCKTDSR